MTTSLIICLAGAFIYIVCNAIGKYVEIAELAKYAFAAGLLAWLLK